MLLSVTGASIDMPDHSGHQVEGQTATLDLACTTNDGGTTDWAIDFGDGSSTSLSIAPDSSGSYSAEIAHAFPGEAGSQYDVHAVITDEADSSGSSTYGSGSSSSVSSYSTDYTLTITEAPLSLSATAISWQVGTPFATAAATLYDGYTLATDSDYSGTIDWGDGQTSDAAFVAVDGAAGQFLVEGTHVYSAPTTTTATVSVNEVGSSAAAVSTTLAVTASSTIVTPKIRVANFQSGGRYSTSTDPGGSVTAVTLYTGLPLCVNIGSTNDRSSTDHTQDGDQAITNEYNWDFGDIGVGTSVSSGYVPGTIAPYNHMTGFNAAHIYDTPGTYHLSLSVTSRSGDVGTANMTVTVQQNPNFPNPANLGDTANSGHVFYVDTANSASTNPDGSLGNPYSSIDQILAHAPTGGTYTVRFADGDHFTYSGKPDFPGSDIEFTDYQKTTSGGLPTGVASQPVLENTATGDFLIPRSQQSGIVFRNLTFNSQDPIQQTTGIAWGGASTDLAVVGCRFFNVAYAIQFPGASPQTDPNNIAGENPSGWDALNADGTPSYGGDVLFQDNYVPNAYDAAIYLGGHDWTILGNSIGGGEVENIIRCDNLFPSVNGFINVYGNDIGPSVDTWRGPLFFKSSLTFRGNTEYCSAEANTFRQTRAEIGFGEGTNVKPSTAMIHLFERNTFIGSYLEVKHPTHFLTVRNNFFESPGAYGTDDDATGVVIDGESTVVDGLTSDVKIVNNTMLSGKTFLDITSLGHVVGGTKIPSVSGILLANNLSAVSNHVALQMDHIAEYAAGPTLIPNTPPSLSTGSLQGYFDAVMGNVWGDSSLGLFGVPGINSTSFSLSTWNKAVPGGPLSDVVSSQAIQMDPVMLVPTNINANVSTIGLGGALYDYNGYRRYGPVNLATDRQTAGAVDQHSPKPILISQDIGTLVIPGSAAAGSFGTDYNVIAGGAMTTGNADASTSDSFHYVYGNLHDTALTAGSSGQYGIGNGNFDVQTNVLSVDNGTTNGDQNIDDANILEITGSPTGGTFTLSFTVQQLSQGQVVDEKSGQTSAITYDASSRSSTIHNIVTAVDAALGQLTDPVFRGMYATESEVHLIDPKIYSIAFHGDDRTLMTASASLMGGSSPQALTFSHVDYADRPVTATSANLNSYGGIMARASTDPSSPYVFIALTPISVTFNSDGSLLATGGTPVMMYRSSSGGHALPVALPTNWNVVVRPGDGWVRLQRIRTVSGSSVTDSYTGYVGTMDNSNTITWSAFGTVSVSLTTPSSGDCLLGLAACSNDGIAGMPNLDTAIFSQNATVMFRSFGNCYDPNTDTEQPGMTVSGANLGSSAYGNAAIVAGYQALEVYGGGTGFNDPTPGTTITNGPTSDSVYFVHSSTVSMSALNGAPIDVIAQISFLETGMIDPEAGLMLRAQTSTSGNGSNPLDPSSAMIFGYATPQGTNGSGNNLDETGVASRASYGSSASVLSETLVAANSLPLNYPEVWIEIRQVDGGGDTPSNNTSSSSHTFQVYESKDSRTASNWIKVGSAVTIANMIGFDIGVAVASGQSAGSGAPNLTDVQVQYVTPASFNHE